MMERYLPLYISLKAREVLVVGGGPAGVAAAVCMYEMLRQRG